MAPRSQSDLVKIGVEGFALTDEYFGRKNRPQAPSAAAAAAPKRANGFQPNQQVSYHRYQPQESYYRYQPQEPQVVRVSQAYTKESVFMKSNYEAAARQTFGVSYY